MRSRAVPRPRFRSPWFRAATTSSTTASNDIDRRISSKGRLGAPFLCVDSAPRRPFFYADSALRHPFFMPIQRFGAPFFSRVSALRERRDFLAIVVQLLGAHVGGGGAH